ncbi:hypothetical protein ACTJLB_09145 [Paraburkholderia sp. 22098]|uniref:hypothetical protein n=1 Tax=Paraburkholderia sp. 22098 TaxID=3453874 RepID=UPI003F8763D3
MSLIRRDDEVFEFALHSLLGTIEQLSSKAGLREREDLRAWTRVVAEAQQKLDSGDERFWSRNAAWPHVREQASRAAQHVAAEEWRRAVSAAGGATQLLWMQLLPEEAGARNRVVLEFLHGEPGQVPTKLPPVPKPEGD